MKTHLMILYFPIQGKRKLNNESIKKAEELNNNFEHYKKI